MLRGIHPALSPELLATLCRMGHGDEIVLADAHFPGENLGPPVLRADGVDIVTLLEGILPLLQLDTYVDAPMVMMDAVPGEVLDPAVEASYREVADRLQPGVPAVGLEERFAFYERARGAFAVVMTGDLAKYGNVILKKGVTTVTWPSRS
ncbi:MAG: L-fucose mutarotase [Planctomycetota bacterium]|nr:L-fucose mutarotase [Planctomycetota bacterium]